jgi:hypothetical protein
VLPLPLLVLYFEALLAPTQFPSRRTTFFCLYATSCLVYVYLQVRSISGGPTLHMKTVGIQCHNGKNITWHSMVISVAPFKNLIPLWIRKYQFINFVLLSYTKKYAIFVTSSIFMQEDYITQGITQVRCGYIWWQSSMFRKATKSQNKGRNQCSQLNIIACGPLSKG